jgi:hypothetical protein
VRGNEFHLSLLHICFLDQINEDLDEFRREWNHHPMRGRNNKNKSPMVCYSVCMSTHYLMILKDFYFDGVMTHGMDQGPIDDVLNETEKDINTLYGVEGREVRRAPGQTGAGHDPDEVIGIEIPAEYEEEHEEPHSEDEFTELEMAMLKSVNKNARHPPVKLPRFFPIFDDEHHERMFRELLARDADQESVPPTSNLFDEDLEWVPQQNIPYTHDQQMAMELPARVWMPRVLQWEQALYRFNQIQLGPTV